VLELRRDQAVGAPEERLGRPVELFPQPVGGLLTYRSHAVLELERAGLASRVDLPLDRPLEALDLAPFELGEGDLDAGVSFALGPVDLLVHGVLVLPQSLVQLVDRASPVVRLQLELVERTSQRIACAAFEVLAQSDGGEPLLVDGCVELV